MRDPAKKRDFLLNIQRNSQRLHFFELIAVPVDKELYVFLPAGVLHPPEGPDQKFNPVFPGNPLDKPDIHRITFRRSSR